MAEDCAFNKGDCSKCQLNLTVLVKLHVDMQSQCTCIFGVAPGLSDPFVQLTLMPPWVFSESSSEHFKTSVLKQTLDPFFNESFKL